MIRFACPGCSATFTVADEKAGKTGKCPKCQSQFVIPEAPAAASPPPSSVASRSVSPPPPPPPPPDDNSNTVEVTPCPKCGSRLSVLPADVGLDIECPNCQAVYKATRADAPPPPPGGESKSGSKSSSLVKLGSGSRRDDDDDDDRPSKKKRSRRDDDDDDDDDDDRPRRKKKRRRSSRGSYVEHRGDMLFILSIVGLLFFRILCIVVWVLANNDLKEMDAGRMDPEGRSKTNSARIIGMIGTILLCVALVLVCVWFVFIFAIIGAAGAGAVR